jgi:hypothetical protein
MSTPHVDHPSDKFGILDGPGGGGARIQNVRVGPLIAVWA